MNKQRNMRALAAAGGKLALRAAPALLLGAFMASPALAGGLSSIGDGASDVLSDIQVIVPVIATIVMIGAGLCYAAHWIPLKWLVNFAVGCGVSGAAGVFVPMLMKFSS